MMLNMTDGKLLWLSDIHLNFIDEARRQKFYSSMQRVDMSSIVITGDIAEADSVNTILEEIVRALNVPIYFVLGNHDYYGGEIESVTKSVKSMCNNQPLLEWLDLHEFIQLTEHTILLGKGGWADARNGDYDNSRVNLNDSRLITDLW